MFRTAKRGWLISYMPKGLNIKIADLVFSLQPKGEIQGFSIDNRYLDFITRDAPDIILKVKKNPLALKQARNPPLAKGSPRGEAEGRRGGAKQKFETSTWGYSRFKGKRIFSFFSSAQDRRPERILFLTSAKRGEIILPEGAKLKNGFLPNPFAYPLDEILLINLLQAKQGALIHSCGFTYQEKGYLFIGSSGAGKSTLARILSTNNQGLILGDDRTVVRKKNGCFRAYGTPWCGEAGFRSAGQAGLKGLLFLKQDSKNNLCRLSPAQAASRLIQCSFLPFWDKAGISSSLKICAELAVSIPAFLFSFRPHKSALDLLKEKLLR